MPDLPVPNTPAPPADDVADSLTRHEWAGLMNTHNLADGHARQAQTLRMREVVARLPELYTAADEVPQLTLQREFEEAFYGLAGQHSVVTRERRPLHHYSSSLSIEVVANYLREKGSRVSLLHPTFDNIPAILRRHQVPLTPITERIFAEPDDPAFYRDTDAIFLVTPNNPTGTDPAPDVMRTIARRCVEHDVLLIVDYSFRFFSAHLAGWDQYAYFESIGLRHIGIEDTGKTWPTLDLKIGSLIADARVYPRLQEITDDLLLNVSPFIFALIRDYVDADRELSSRQVGAVNRGVLERALEGGPVTPVPAAGPMSVAWLRLPEGWRASDLCDWLTEQEVSVLPGWPFFWADHSAGEGFVRVALMRSEGDFADAARALAEALERYASRGQDAPDTGVDIDALVLRLAAELLERPDATLADDFFALGGDSMSAMHLVGRIAKETGLPLRVKAMFDGPVLGDLAARVRELRERSAAAGAQAPADPLDRLRMSFAARQPGA
ncbi:aminotransferase class I/II-fold pyridoxal phosphate-dependent enzyme [Saccharothrix hoggarensis]|uniref:Aminotransferase class I/II-fold pyridoxal phosphate-dependent enzyme n=1 Tax=Saccharothrix hoggarensis TaxID=913853 RepID=A0ABW3R2U5_9PSEU